MELYEKDSTIFNLNRKAMDHLRNEDYKSSLFFLQKAESLLNSLQSENRRKLYGLTLNNFGCYYKRTNNLPIALNFLKKALEVQSQPPVDLNNLAGTHLNICAILSNMNEHSKALAHSLKALNLLKSRSLEDNSMLTAYIAAHHNSGVEYEQLAQFEEAEKIFRKGFKISFDMLGEGHPLTQSLKASIVNLVNGRVDRKKCYSRGSSNTQNPKTLLIHRTKSASKNRPKLLSRPDNLRFITGERLQPMFRQEIVQVKPSQIRASLNSSSLVKTLKQSIESSGSSESIKETNSNKSNDDHEVSSEVKNYLNHMQTSSKSESEERPARPTGPAGQISIATQVEMFDSNYYLSMQEKAAILIQKNIRRFLAKRLYQLLKYQKMLKDAEKQAKEAKAKLKSLRQPVKKPQVAIQQSGLDLVPIAYKDKLDSPKRTVSTRMSRIYSRLSTIIEENDSILSKVIKIQKNYRGWKVRRDYLMKRGSAILIQKNVRRYQVQKLYLKIRDAIIFIQASWRRYLRRHPLRKCYFHSISLKKRK